jgi:hypothetical protein
MKDSSEDASAASAQALGMTNDKILANKALRRNDDKS